MKIKTRQEQREEFTVQCLVSAGLYCHLLNLMREILAGNTAVLPDFQQSMQYAPAEMRSKLLERLNADSVHEPVTAPNLEDEPMPNAIGQRTYTVKHVNDQTETYTGFGARVDHTTPLIAVFRKEDVLNHWAIDGEEAVLEILRFYRDQQIPVRFVGMFRQQALSKGISDLVPHSILA